MLATTIGNNKEASDSSKESGQQLILKYKMRKSEADETVKCEYVSLCPIFRKSLAFVIKSHHEMLEDQRKLL